jgi:hypothetical protein
MERETIIGTVQELPTDTQVKAWVFECEKKFYHVAAYSRFRMGDLTSIWESNKKGKRLTTDPIFSTNGKDHIKCINSFIDKLELEKIDSGSEG